jgi:uncharacterized membrane protein
LDEAAKNTDISMQYTREHQLKPEEERAFRTDSEFTYEVGLAADADYPRLMNELDRLMHDANLVIEAERTTQHAADPVEAFIARYQAEIEGRTTGREIERADEFDHSL